MAGVTLWLLSSAALSVFIAHFSGFNVTYGSFAAAIVLLIWLWLTNVALLFGAEVNAEIERQKKLAEVRPRIKNAEPPTTLTDQHGVAANVVFGLNLRQNATFGPRVNRPRAFVARSQMGAGRLE